MKHVAIVEKQPSNIRWSQYFNFKYTPLYLTEEKNNKKLLKKEVTLDIDNIKEKFDYIITIGAEPTKWFTGKQEVVNTQGTLIKDKFLPLINPNMLTFKPTLTAYFNQAVERISNIVTNNILDVKGDYRLLTTKEELLSYINSITEDTITVDTETSALYARKGYVLGISISNKENQGVYFSTDIIDIEIERRLQELFNYTTVVMHNAKFDIHMLNYWFNFKFPKIEDTMLMHSILDENSSHGLKDLTNRFLPHMANYEAELDSFKADYCKAHGMRQGDFTYDLIPLDIIWKYAAKDTSATIQLYNLFKPKLDKNKNLTKAYNMLLDFSDVLCNIEERGVPILTDKLSSADKELEDGINEKLEELYSYPEIKELEAESGAKFNINSYPQLRKLFFDKLGLPTFHKTATGAYSVDSSVMDELEKLHPIVGSISELRKLKKIKSTYIDKIRTNLDRDNRIRTNFNLHSTTSGRLSSSGTINLQQLPREGLGKKIVKGLIGKKGYKVVAMDLTTAEMWVAAVLSKDNNLLKVFENENDDFHSFVAKSMFKLDCEVKDVKRIYSQQRQAAKAISFGILYGAGPNKVAEQADCSLQEAKEFIALYNRKFPKLHKWVEETREFIINNGFTYQVTGRKRRAISFGSKEINNEIRSIFNSVIQGPASDINMLALTNLGAEDYDTFMVVHDSIITIVKDEEVNSYIHKVTEAVEEVSMKLFNTNVPVQLDFEIGDTYADCN